MMGFTMYTVVVDEDLLKAIVKRLVDAADPERIVLFGSRARGDHQSDSDLDLLIVADSAEPPHRRAVRAYHALRGLGVPEGRVLYEKRR
jgi:predicted nucleotidyltransferase